MKVLISQLCPTLCDPMFFWMGAQSVNQSVFNEHLLYAQPCARNAVGYTRNARNLCAWEIFTGKLETETQ